MLPPYLSDDVKSGAERRIFERLRDDPDTDGWIVLHSLGLSRHAHKRYGELDFVVIVPGGAIVCLEVKGGRVSCRDGKWETINRYDETNSLSHSPFDQAREGMFALRKIVEDKADDGALLSKLSFGYGVMFPDIAWEHEGAEYENYQVYSRSFRAPISAYIKGIVAYNADARKGYARPTLADTKRLTQFLRPDFEAPICPIGQIENNEAALLRLLEEQFEVLDALALNPRIVLEGAAGTGKTLLALEAARRAAARGERVLLLCFNSLLGSWIERAAARYPHAENIVAGSFHRFLKRDIIEKSALGADFEAAWLQAQADHNQSQFFAEDYPLYALDAIAQNAIEPFDLVLIDEGQDLIFEESLTLFDQLLRGGLAGGRWMLCADFNRQAIFADGRDADAMREQLRERGHSISYGLQRNCRNTKRIGRETALLSGFDHLPFALHAQSGDSVDYRFYDSDKKQRKIIGEIVGRLLDDGLKPADIVLLSPKRRDNSCLFQPVEALQERGIFIANLDKNTLFAAPPDSVLFSTLHAFKGLERRAIIVIGVERLGDEEFRAALYVAMSRPTVRLYVLLHESVRDEYNELVKKGQQWQNAGA